MSLLEQDWEYTAKPGEVPRDNVRELVGDTDKLTKLVSDTTIELALTVSNGNEQVAAAEVAKKIAARFAKEATSKSGKDYSRTMERHKAYLELSKMLRSSDPTTVPSAAQTRCSTSAAIYANGDIRRGAFRTGMFHSPEWDPRTEITDQDLLNDSRNTEGN